MPTGSHTHAQRPAAGGVIPTTLRDRRDRRDRPTWVQERSRAVDRLQGVLERTNITLAAVATDMMGVSRRAILAALIHG